MEVTLVNVAFFITTIVVPIVTIEGGYIGCYLENRRRRDFPHNPGGIRLGTLTPARCYTVCGGLDYSYAAVGLGQFCFCSNTNPDPVRFEADNTKCSVPCSGDPSEMCGSMTHIRVFDALAPIKLTVDATPSVVQTGSMVTFTPTAITNGPGYQLRMDYDDGAGDTGYQTSGAGLLNRTYKQAGQYEVSSSATDPSNLLLDVVTSVQVEVHSLVDGLIVNCSSQIITYHTDRCDMQLARGTDVELNVQYTDGHNGPVISHMIYIGDIKEHRIGNPVQEKLSLSDPSLASVISMSGKVLHFANPAKHDGKLLGFEYFAVATGSLDLYIYTPDCGSDEYCVRVQNCVSIGQCDITCLSGVDTYATDIQACATAGYPGPVPFAMAYTMIYHKLVTITDLGYGYLDVSSEDVYLIPGAIVAHDAASGNAKLAVVPSSTGFDPFSDLYCSSQAGLQSSVDGSLCSLTHEFHQLKAVYTLGLKASIPFEFTNPGNVSMTFMVQNRNPAVAGTQTYTHNTVVMEGVNASVFNIPGCLETVKTNELWLEPFTGSPASVTWNFDTGAPVVGIVDQANITFAYLHPGIYNISANVSNAFSWKLNSTLLCVQERIQGIALAAPAEVEVGVLETLSLTLGTGSDYNCTVTFTYSDGSTEMVTKTEAEVLGGGNIDHTFYIAGPVNIDTECTNLVGTNTSTVILTAFERISGVALTPPGAMVNTDFQIYVGLDTGSDFQVSLTYDGQPVSMAVNGTRSAVSTTTLLENVTGLHTVSVTVSNAINNVSANFTFAIEVAITNPVITCIFSNEIVISPPIEYAVIPAGESVICNVSMTDGTSVEMLIDWGDGTANYSHIVGQGQPWSSNTLTMPITHSYTSPMFCQLRVTLRNNFNEEIGDFPVMVMVGVDNVVLDAVSPVSNTPPASVNFTWTITSGPVPIGVTCNMDWGDGYTQVITDLNLTSVLYYQYSNSPGTVTLNYNLTNYINWKAGTLQFEIVTPIIDNVCSSNPVAGIPGEPIDLVFKSQRGPGAGILDLTFDCDTAVTGTIGTRKRTYNSPDGEDTEECIYANNGSYTASVLATSLLESKECFHTMQILNPVTDQFTVTTNAPIDYERDFTCNVDYTFYYFGPTPDDSWLEFTYGDGEVSVPIPFAENIQHQHTYQTPGHYTTKFRLYNLASEVTVNVSSGCYAKITDASMDVLREPLIPVGSPDLPGFGGLADKFRTDEPLKVWPVLHTGTFAWYEVNVTGATFSFVQNETNEEVFGLAITEFGLFDLSVQPKNPLYQGPVLRFSGEFVQPISNVSIRDYGNETVAFIDRKFLVTMDSYSSVMCIAVQNGINSNPQLYGDATTCSTAIGEYNVVPSISEMQQPFHLHYQYNEEGSYTISLSAWNMISNETTDFTFPVSGLDCSAPNIGIVKRRRNFRYPLKFRRCKRLKVSGIINLDCPKTLNNTRQWTIKNWNGTYNEEIKDIDITNVSSSVNLALALEPRFLPYGLYRLNFKVTMVTPSSNGERFFGQAETFIEVVSCNLTVQQFPNGMLRKTVGPASTLTLSPRTYSFDPDVGDDGMNDLDSFEMACRDVTAGEVYPDFGVKVSPLNITDLPYGHIDTGGWFRQGPGWLSPFSGTITFVTSILKPLHTYEFLIIGYKDTRSANFTGQIVVKAEEPPEFIIDFKIPGILSANSEGKFFSPNSQQLLVANISTDCGGCTYLYDWSVLVWNYEYCTVDSDCMEPLNSQRLIDQTLAAGLQESELVLYKKLFSDKSTVNKFQVRLKITNDLTGATGEGSLNLIRNTPPKNGTGVITPSVGVVYQTEFTVTLEGFIDDDHEIVDYKVTCEVTGMRTEVCQGSDTVYEKVNLPIGDEQNSNQVNCFVIVTDELGATDTFIIPPIQVTGPPVSEFRNMMVGFDSSDNDESDVIDATADLPQTVAYAGACVSQLKRMGQQDEDQDYADIGCAPAYQSSGLLDTRERKNAFQTRTTNSEKSLEYENIRNSCARLVAKLTLTMTKCTIESPSEALSMVTTIENLSNSKEHLSRTTQNQMMQMLELAVEIMKNYTTSIPVEELEEMGNSILSAIANIDEAAKLAVDRPTNDDLESQESSFSYDTNLDSNAPGVPDYEDSDAQIRVAKTNQNKFEQTNFAVVNLDKSARIQRDVTEMFANVKVISKTATTISSNGIEVQVFKLERSSLANMEITTGGGRMKLPSNFGLWLSSATIVMKVSARASGGISSDGSPECPYSRENSLSIHHVNGTEIPVVNLIQAIEVEVYQDPNRIKDDDSSLPIMRPVISGDDTYLVFNKFEVKYSRSAVKLQFRFGPGEATSDKQLLVLINKDIPPAIDSTLSRVIQVCMIPSSTSKAGTYGDSKNQDPYSCFIDNDIIETYGTGNYSLGLRELDSTELDRFPDIPSLPTVDYVQNNWKREQNFSISYQLKTVEITCTSRGEGSSVRNARGVKPSPTSTSDCLRCYTNHLTSFAAGWLVVPNTIDFDHVFSNADFLKNPTLYVTEIVIFVVYILAMIWARRRDKEDITKLGLLPLLDNDPRDKYYYEIVLDTGMRRHAGTESKVYFVLSGEEEETDVRTFTNSKRKIFSRGSTDGFLMAVSSSLGALMYLRIWHDNSGQGKMKSWYLNHILIRDVQTDKKYYFIANRWWAVEEDDGQVDRVIPVAGKEQMTEFSHLFKERASKNLSDGHLWFSVVARPPQSRFTRCQRVSCCLCLLYVSMLANAMFYELATSDSSAFQFGPFAFSAEQIYVGIVVNLIVFPINFLIIMLFRKSKPRKLRPSRVEAAIKSSKTETAASVDEINPRVQSPLSMSGRTSQLSIGLSRLQISPTPDREVHVPVVVEKKKFLLPWGCSIFAWILLWLTVLASAVFVTFYGITFGDSKCRKWITSMIISFLTSIFFTQPLKVLLIAIIFSVLIRKPGNEYDAENDEEPTSNTIEQDEQYLHDDDDYRLVAPIKPLLKKPVPPNSKLIEAARKERLKEIQMWAVVREILFYMFYMTILIIISYRSVNTYSYWYKFSMERVFISTNNTNHSFTKVKNVQDYWIWARTGMLRGLRAGPYYNNFPPFYLRGYINDKQSRIMGYATLRQVRVRAGSCKVPDLVDDIITECNAPYEIDLEENGSFGPGWTDISTANVTRPEYQYRDADSLNGYPYWGEMAWYGGGGYVVNLDSSYETMLTQFGQLEQEKWIDEYTRAVFLEFTVYNPSVNMFAISTILSEFRPSGGVFGSYRFEPCTLLPYMNGMLLFQIICELTYLCFTVFFVVKELRYIYKQKCSYFKQFWNLVEFSITAMSVTAVVIYFYRLVEVNELTDYFEKTNGNGYMKFQSVGYWSEIFQYIIGFLVFLATLKFLKLLRFNKKICLLASTLKSSANNLIHFSIIFNVLFFAFVQVFYLVYVRHLTTFKTLVRACEACIVMMMGKFDIYKMSEVDRWFTQIFLFLFVITITFIVVNMFLSILNESFSTVRNDLTMQQNDYEIVDFILHRFKRWTGIGQQKPRTLSPEELERERRNEEFDDHMTQLDNQIDRFLTSVSNMYVRKSKFDDFLNTGMYSKMAQKVAAHNAAFPPERHPAPRPGAIPLNLGSRGRPHDMTY